MSAISIQRVSKAYKETQALKGVSFEVPEGGIFGLLGPNGAGKTTLFSTIASFVRPDEGDIKVLGTDIREISKLQGKLGILPQDAQFQSNIPILDQLVFFSELTGLTADEAEKEAYRSLELVGLKNVAKRNARTLSHGMHKRLGIAQAFLGNPEVVMLDEPTAGLDPKAAAGIRDLISKFAETATIVISSHDLREIQRLCSAVAILDHGKLVACKTVEDLTGGGELLRLTFAKKLTEPEISALESVEGVESVVLHKDLMYIVQVLTSNDKETVIADIARAMADHKAVPRAIEDGMDLEETFLRLTDDATSAN